MTKSPALLFIFISSLDHKLTPSELSNLLPFLSSTLIHDFTWLDQLDCRKTLQSTHAVDNEIKQKTDTPIRSQKNEKPQLVIALRNQARRHTKLNSPKLEKQKRKAGIPQSVGTATIEVYPTADQILSTIKNEIGKDND